MFAGAKSVFRIPQECRTGPMKAVLKLAGRVVALRTDPDHVVLGEPRGRFQRHLQRSTPQVQREGGSIDRPLRACAKRGIANPFVNFFTVTGLLQRHQRPRKQQEASPSNGLTDCPTESFRSNFYRRVLPPIETEVPIAE